MRARDLRAFVPAEIRPSERVEPGSPAWLGRRRSQYPALVDLGDGEPPRRVASLEWDDEHQALIVGVE